MELFVRNRPYTGPLQAVVLDWAGTAVDHGCMGPAAVFVAAFARHGVEVIQAEAREPMGREKKEHVRVMCRMPGVAARWRKVHGREPDEAAVEAVYADVEPLMVEAIANHAEPVPGLLDFVAELKRQGVLLGSCTGYTAPMMAVLAAEAARRSYVPDAIVCSSDVPAGRPYPWMCYLNAIRLGVYPMEAMAKIGDTVADIEEGLNAGMWTIGVARTSNDLGLTETGLAALGEAERRERVARVAARLRGAGAHYVVDTVADCLPVLARINERLARGEVPSLQSLLH